MFCLFFDGQACGRAKLLLSCMEGDVIFLFAARQNPLLLENVPDRLSADLLDSQLAQFADDTGQPEICHGC